MKKQFTLLLFLLIAAFAYSQTPRLINYQGLARGKDGTPVTDQAITIQFDILQGGANGTMTFTEQQALTTTSLGMISTQIGKVNSLAGINWENGPFYLKVSVDFKGGNDVQPLGNPQQLLGVPFSMHASSVPSSYSATTNELTVGGKTYTLASTTIDPHGALTVSTTATNSFILTVPETSVSMTSTAGVSGISSAGTNSYNINVPPVITPTITGGGAAVITPTNVGSDFTITVPPTDIAMTQTGTTATVTSIGTNSFNINIPTAVTPTVLGIGMASVTSVGSTYTVDVPLQTYNALNGDLVSGTNTLNITQPMVISGTTLTSGVASNSVNLSPLTTTVVANGMGNVTNVGNLYSVNIPTLTYAGTSGALATGTNVVNITQSVALSGSTLTSGATTNTVNLSPLTTTVVATGMGSVTNVGNLYTVNIPTLTYAQTSGALTTGSNVVNITQSVALSGSTLTSGATTNTVNLSPLTTTVVANGMGNVTNVGNLYTVNIPTLTYAQTSGALATGTNVVNITQSVALNGSTLTSGATTNTVNLSPLTTTVVANGMGNVTNVGNLYTVNIPTLTYAQTSGALATGTNVVNITQSVALSGSTLTSGATTNTVNLSPLTTTVVANGMGNVTNVGNLYTVNIPTLTYASTTGALTTGTNVVNITPPVSLSGSTLTTGATTNTVNLSPLTTTVVANGMGNVTNVGNLYTVNIPTLTYAAASGALTTGTNVVNITPPVSLSGSTLTTGATTNTVNLSPLTTTVVANGMGSVTNVGNLYTVNIPTLTYAQTSGALATGTNVVNITQSVALSGSTLTSGATTNTVNLSPLTTTVVANGMGNVTNVGNLYTVNIPTLTYAAASGALTTGTNVVNITPPVSLSGSTLTTGATTNTVNLSPLTTTVVANGMGNVTNVGNLYTVNIPTLTYATASGALTTGTNVVNITPPVSLSGSTLTTGATTNTVNLSPLTTTVVANGMGNVTNVGNLYTVNIPTLTYAAASGALTTGTNVVNITQPVALSGSTLTSGAMINTVNLSPLTTTVVANGMGSVTNVGNLYTVNIPTLTYAAASGALTTGTNVVNITPPVSLSGSTLTTGATTNTVNLSPLTTTVVATGMGSVTNVGNLYTVNIPTLTYNSASGALTTGTNVVNITQPMSLSGTTLTSGLPSNSVNLSAVGPWRQSVNTVTLGNVGDKVNIGGTTATENLQIQSATSPSLSLLAAGSGTSDIMFGTTINHTLGRIRYDNSIGAMSLWTNGTSKATIDNNGQMVIGANTTYSSNTGLTISRNGAFANQLMITGGDNSNSFGGIVTLGESLSYVGGMSMKLDAGGNRLWFTNDLAGNNPVVAIGGYSGSNNGMVIGTGFAGGIQSPVDGLLVQGDVGIGSTNPGTKLEVIGDITIPNGNRIVFGTQSSGSGIGEWIQNSPTGLQLVTASVPRMNITALGNIGVGITSPTSALHVDGVLTVGNGASIGSIQTNGSVRMGSEAIVAPPNQPGGSTGLVIRRVFNSMQIGNAGIAMGATDVLRFERDGTFGGFQINHLGTTARETCYCTGINSSGATVNKTFNSLITGVTPIYADTENMVFFHCVFGDQYGWGLGHVTELTLSRFPGDYFWTGTISSSFNQ